MTDTAADSPRQAYGGDARRERPTFEVKTLGPWKARVAVVPLVLGGGRTLFEVVCEWTGPPLEPMPDPGVPVNVTDAFTVDTHELASRVAGEAADELRAGRRPALRAIAERAGKPAS